MPTAQHEAASPALPMVIHGRQKTSAEHSEDKKRWPKMVAKDV